MLFVASSTTFASVPSISDSWIVERLGELVRRAEEHLPARRPDDLVVRRVGDVAAVERSAADDLDVLRVVEQRAGVARARAEIDRPARREARARDLGEAAVAAQRAAARRERAVEARGLVGPDDDRAAVAGRDRVGAQRAAPRPRRCAAPSAARPRRAGRRPRGSILRPRRPTHRAARRAARRDRRVTAIAPPVAPALRSLASSAPETDTTPPSPPATAMSRARVIPV